MIGVDVANVLTEVVFASCFKFAVIDAAAKNRQANTMDSSMSVQVVKRCKALCAHLTFQRLGMGFPMLTVSVNISLCCNIWAAKVLTCIVYAR